MKCDSRALDVEVTREKSEIVDEFMGYRNDKVESDADFPASYKSNIYGRGSPAEDAFYYAFADSTLRMTITPGTGFENPEDIKRAIESTEHAEVGLRAKVEGIQDHAPVIQTGIDALEEAGLMHMLIFGRKDVMAAQLRRRLMKLRMTVLESI